MASMVAGVRPEAFHFGIGVWDAEEITPVNTRLASRVDAAVVWAS